MSYISLTNQVIIEQEALALRACYTDHTEVMVELATTGSREMNNSTFRVELVVLIQLSCMYGIYAHVILGATSTILSHETKFAITVNKQLQDPTETTRMT